MKKGLVFGGIALLIIVTIVIIVVTNKHCDESAWRMWKWQFWIQHWKPLHHSGVEQNR